MDENEDPLLVKLLEGFSLQRNFFFRLFITFVTFLFSIFGFIGYDGDEALSSLFSTFVEPSVLAPSPSGTDLNPSSGIPDLDAPANRTSCTGEGVSPWLRTVAPVQAPHRGSFHCSMRSTFDLCFLSLRLSFLLSPALYTFGFLHRLHFPSPHISFSSCDCWGWGLRAVVGFQDRRNRG